MCGVLAQETAVLPPRRMAGSFGSDIAKLRFDRSQRLTRSPGLNRSADDFLYLDDHTGLIDLRLQSGNGR